MPLALLELPLFVLLPKLYNELFGLPIATVGLILLVTRAIDAALDPFIGVWLDRAQKTPHRPKHYRFWISAFMPLLLVGFGALLWAPSNQAMQAGLWLGGFSILTYISYSVVSISYQAWGAQWGSTNNERAKVTSTREACGLVGVLIASVWLSPDKRLALMITMLLLSGVAILMLYKLPVPVASSMQPLGSFSQTFANKRFVMLASVFAINGIASAIPATLVLFFIADVVGAKDSAPLFLGAYFLAGAVGLPAWALLSKRIGLRNTWLVGMLFAVFAFVSALSVERGDSNLFLLICLLTGLALGADLAMPPALLAMVIAEDSQPNPPGEATYFGLWNLITKLNLAIAAGISLPLLQWLGYTPSSSSISQSTLALTLVYAALPCALKLIAGMTLLLAPLKEGSK